MSFFTRRHRRGLQIIALASATVFITIAMVKFPKDAFDAAILGVNLWWDVVFPALLPFFILSEILMGLGVVHFVGVLLEPLMRPIFNVPGVGAFAMSMGLASGYPMDAVITCKFRKNKLCSAVEAERLLSFTNTADPLFMFGAVAVGMFGAPELGALIALAHYASSFLVGIIFRFHGRKRDIIVPEPIPQGNILLRALQSLFKARREDGRSIGQLLGDAVRTSMNTILLIGGFIILFSVLIRIATVVGATAMIEELIAKVIGLVGLSTKLAPAIVSGLFEIDLGTMAASQADAPLVQRVSIAGAIIAWSGLSVHGQVASIVIESGIRMGPYICARFLHAVLAGLLTAILMQADFLALLVAPVTVIGVEGNTVGFWLQRFQQTVYQFVLLTVGLVAISLFLAGIKHIYRRLK